MDSVGIRAKSFVIATLVSILFIGLFSVVLWQYKREQKKAYVRHSESIVAGEIMAVRSSLESSLHRRLNLPISLKAFVVSNPDFTETEFEKFANNLVATTPGIMSLQLAPNAVVRYVTNKEKHQKAIGHDLLGDVDRRPAVLRAIQERRFIVAGPLNLLQGGRAIVARLPIFIEGHASERNLGNFWGFATVLIDLEQLFASAYVGEINTRTEIAIRGVDGLGSAGDVFYGSPKIFDRPTAIAEIVIPNGSWQVGAVLRAAPLAHDQRLFTAASVSVGLLLAAGLWFLVYRQGSADLLRAKNEAERASQLKTNFLAVMSHEMRTPLNGVLGVLDLLRQTRLGDSQKHYVDVAIASGEVLLRHVNDVLDITKIEAGQISFDKKALDLEKLVEGVIEISRPAAEANGTSILAHVALPAHRVEGDPHRIRQILLNLIGNATKFTQGGLITVKVNAVDTVAASDMVEFAVEDTGIGILPEDQERIFEDFVSLDTSYDRTVSGTGLGLSICKRLVAAMGGEIGVEGARTGGSRFWFRLPLRRADDGLQSEQVAQEKTFVSPSTKLLPNVAGRLLDILLVEDNDTNRMVARDMLEAAGHSITEARDGAEAIEAAEARSFDFILMDISMPRVDGISATRAIRSNSGVNRETPIIGLTAHAMEEEQRRFFDAGMQGCLIKPLRTETLNSVLGFRPSCERRANDNPGPSSQADDKTFLDGKTLEEMAATLTAEVFDRTICRVHDEIAAETPKIIGATDGDWNELAATAHKLAGSVTLVGARRLYEVLAQIEVGARSGDAHMVRAAVDRLSEAADGTLRVLRNYSKAAS